MPLHRLASRGGLLLAAALCSSSLVLSPAAAREHENFSVATPFEVGDSPAGNYLAGLVAGAERDTGAAATFFREALRFDPRNQQLLERAFVAAVSNGNMREAFRFAARLVAREPTNGLAHLALGVEDMKLHQYSAARGQFTRGGASQEHDLTATLLTAWTYAGNHQTKKALEVLDKLHDQTFSIFRDYHEALIADVGNDVPAATAAFKAAYDTDKSTLRLVDAYARFLSRHDDSEEAIRIYQDFDQVVPDHPTVQAALADLKAGKMLTPIVRTPVQGAAEVLYGLGAAGGRQGDDLAALIYLRLALYLDPNNNLATLTLGDLYERLKQYEPAIDIYQSVSDSDPLRLTADIETAQSLENLGKNDEATKLLTKIVADHPGNAEALTSLGNLQRVHKQYAEAVATYTKAIALSKKPDKADWPLYYFRGIAYERQKDWPPAEADFKHALQLYPDQPLVLNYLGYSWVDKGIHLDEALLMLRRAVELRPTDGYIVDSLGWADYKLGRYDDAVKELERAVNLKPSDPVINDHLGDAYWRVGRKLEAHFQWNHARDLKPDAADLPKILQKIAHGLDAKGKPAAAETTPTKSGG
ncbi:Beta-barrel assembly-enhancing protease [Methylovirgula sp. HY1]|nr:Beta-barrel assembly-enhancing protease [Methylovirgula sp. HY1]